MSQKAKRILHLAFIVIVSFSLTTSLITPSVPYNIGDASNAIFAQSDESNDSQSDPFTLTVSSEGCPEPGNEEIVGDETNGDDVIVGTNGKDKINGGLGDDTIHGCDGNDQLFGNNDDDTLTGGLGADRFECGNGDDTITDYNPSEGDIIVDIENCEHITTVGPTTFVTIISPEEIICEQPLTSVTVSGTVSENFDTVELFEEGNPIPIGSAQNVDGEWQITVDLSEGEHTLFVKATDTIGCESGCELDSTSITITVKCTTIDTPEIIECEQPLTVTGTFNGDIFDTVTVFVDDNEVGEAELDGDSWSFEIPAESLTEGEHTIRVVASESDCSEDCNTDEAEITITVKCTTIDTPEIIECEQPLTVTGTFNGDIFDTVTVFVDDNEVGEAELDGDSWSFEIPAESLTEGEHTIRVVASESDCSEDCNTDEAEITITVKCTTIDTPEIIECEQPLTVTGTFNGDIFDTVTVFVDDNEVGEAELDGDSWSFEIPAESLTEGEHTIRVVASESDCSEDCNTDEAEITITVECPDDTTITPPDTECEQATTVTGTFDAEFYDTVEVFVDGNSIGTAELDGNTWSIEIPGNLLTEGDHTITAVASDEEDCGEGSCETPNEAEITITVECPPPDGGGGGGGGAGGGAAGGGGAGGAGGGGAGGAGGGAAAGSAVTNVQRSIFRVPYTEIECVQSVVELREDLIPTTDFPAVVEEVKSQHNLTVLNVWNVPEYKAMLLAEGDEEKLSDDDRFLPAETTCGEIILEAVLPANIQELAQDVISQYHVKVVDIIDMPEYKAIVILAEPDNPITKDPRFINYNEDYQLSENYTGSGELNLKYGHIAAPPTVIEEEITPDSIKRTFSAEELDEDDTQSEGGEEAEVDVDIAILDTGIDLDHPDLNVYKDFSVIGINQTGDDDQGHGTHVAGIAAAKDNGIGVIGGAPGARLWAVKVCDSEGKCKISDMIKGVQYVTEHADEIDVANISVETPLSPALNRAISASIKAGVTFVVAAGNYGQDASLTSPASSPDVITVSAIADTDGKCGGEGPAPDIENATDDTFAPFSNFGPSVSIAAPGVSVLSTYLDGEYAVDSGTSMASPSVAAAAALIKANSTDLTPKEIKDNLLNTGSTPLTPCQGGPQGYFSGDPDSVKEPLLFRK